MKEEKSQNIRVRFGQAVRKRRHELSLSQEDLANLSELHRTYISGVERGLRNISLENIEKLSAALDLSLSELMHEVEAA